MGLNLQSIYGGSAAPETEKAATRTPANASTVASTPGMGAAMMFGFLVGLLVLLRVIYEVA